MNRRNFFKLTGTCTGGLLLLPDFLYSYALQENLTPGDSCLVFVQLNGGNDGLNTFIPYQDELYYKYRPAIAINKNDVIAGNNGMAFHPALKGLADIQQKGDLTVIQNVGYPEPNRSHFRSQEIWVTANPEKYLDNGWLGRFLDLQCDGHNPTAGINIDSVDALALRGNELNAITVNNPAAIKNNSENTTAQLSQNPQLDFVRKLANSVNEGADKLKAALDKAAPAHASYPKSQTAKKMEWIAGLIKGGLNSKVYYTSLSGFDTHDGQLNKHNGKLAEMGDAVNAFYTDLKAAGKMDEVTVVIFSEFGRRVQDNGRGTDHGTAAPMFIVGGKNRGKIIGKNPDLVNLEHGDLIYEHDFRSVYAALLKDKFAFDPKQIGISNAPLKGIFG